MLFNMRKLIYCFVFFVLCFSSYDIFSQNIKHKYAATFGVNYSKIIIDSYSLNFKPGINFSINRTVTFKKFNLLYGLEYYQKGARFSFYFQDTIKSTLAYYDNMPYVNLNYIGTNLILRKQIFRTRFWIGVKYNINFLFSGTKYSYRYDMIRKELVQDDISVFDQNNNILFSKSLYKFEQTIGAQITFKLPILARSYLNFTYDSGIRSIYSLINTRSHAYNLSYSYLF